MFRKIYPKVSLIDYIKRQFSERIRLSSILWVVIIQLAIFLGTLMFIASARNVPVKSLVTTSWVTLLVLFGDGLIRGPLGEELGWRAFVLTELQKKFNPLKSAIIVGVLWGFWHTPLWLMSGYSGMQLVKYIVYFLVTIIATSIIITAFYNLNRNLLIPIIIHQLVNYLLVIQTGELVNTFMYTAGLYAFAALVLVLINYKKCLYGNMPNELPAES